MRAAQMLEGLGTRDPRQRAVGIGQDGVSWKLCFVPWSREFRV